MSQNRLFLALLAFPVTAATAGVPNMSCQATGSVSGPEVRRQEASDAFRVQNGRLYHRSNGRDEYFYNSIAEVGSMRYASGQMLFVMTSGGRRGYVVIAAPNDWRVVDIDCTS